MHLLHHGCRRAPVLLHLLMTASTLMGHNCQWPASPATVLHPLKAKKVISLMSGGRGLAPGWLLCLMSPIQRIVPLWCVPSSGPPHGRCHVTDFCSVFLIDMLVRTINIKKKTNWRSSVCLPCFPTPPEGHGGLLEIGGPICSSSTGRHENPQPLLHPGGCIPVHRPAIQQRPNGQRGKMLTLFA